MFFKNRQDAGQKLAEIFLSDGRDWSSWNIVGLARGGVIVASEIAKALAIPLQTFCLDNHPLNNGQALTVTSLNTGSLRYLDRMKYPEFIPSVLDAEFKDISKLIEELGRRHNLYNLGRPFVVQEKIIVCDDGLVSGRTVFVAIETLRHLGAKEIVLAVPVVPPWFTEQKLDFELKTWRVTTMQNPTSGIFYFSFEQNTDEEVIEAMRGSLQH